MWKTDGSNYTSRFVLDKTGSKFICNCAATYWSRYIELQENKFRCLEKLVKINEIMEGTMSLLDHIVCSHGDPERTKRALNLSIKQRLPEIGQSSMPSQPRRFPVFLDKLGCRALNIEREGMILANLGQRLHQFESRITTLQAEFELGSSRANAFIM
jgi:hypothetical protein